MITIHNYNIPDKAKIYLIFLFFYPLVSFSSKRKRILYILLTFQNK